MPLSYGELVAVFGPADVVRVDPEALAGLGLPTEARRTLVEVGLPRATADDYFQWVPPSVFDVPELGRRYCRIVRSVSRDIAVDLATGEVWSLSSAEPATRPAFVNSTVAAFVECVSRQELLLRRMPEDRGDEESAEWARRFADELRAIDPRCLTEPDSYFAGFVEETRIGLV